MAGLQDAPNDAQHRLEREQKHSAMRADECADECNQQTAQAPDGSAMQYNPEAWAAELFRFHKPTLEQIKQMEAVRDAASNLALVAFRNAPTYSPEFQEGIATLRNAVMLINSAIVRR